METQSTYQTHIISTRLEMPDRRERIVISSLFSKKNDRFVEIRN